MLKIVTPKHPYQSTPADFELENGVTLWACHWDGGKYVTGTVYNGEKWVKNFLCYRPVWEDDEDDAALLGFEESRL